MKNFKKVKTLFFNSSFREFWYTKINQTQSWYDELNNTHLRLKIPSLKKIIFKLLLYYYLYICQTLSESKIYTEIILN